MISLANRSGDTLIEVIFAFAILGMIIGLSFTGVIGGRRSAVAAQERTQATFLAQYQAEALKAYRNSLDWDSVSAGNGDNFIDGNTITGLPDLDSLYITPHSPFCMSQTGSKWAVVASSTTSLCNTDPLYAALPQDGSTPRVTIYLNRVTGDPNTILANITVHWLDAQRRPADVIQQVTLTKAK